MWQEDTNVPRETADPIESISESERTVLVFGEKTFRIKIRPGQKLTYGPWSPPSPKSGFNGGSGAIGTLRVYDAKDKTSCIAVFSGVTGYRDEALDYSEKVVTEEVSTVWRSDRNGYHREVDGKRSESWQVEPSALTEGSS